MTHLTVLEVVEEDVETLRLHTIFLDDNARAADDLAGVALTVDLAETSPGSEDFGIADLDEVDVVFGAKSFDELYVLGLSTSVDQDTKMSLALVQSLSTFTETTSETVVNESVLKNLL